MLARQPPAPGRLGACSGAGHAGSSLALRLLQEESELEVVMRAADLDGDGTLNYEEFICATANLAKLEKEANILAAFKQALPSSMPTRRVPSWKPRCR